MKPDQEQALRELNNLYEAAKAQGKCHKKSEFADLLGVDRAVLSTIMNASAPITSGMQTRIRNAASAKGIIQSDGSVTNTQENSTFTGSDPRWFELVAEKDKQISRLLGIIEKMQ